MVARKIRRSKSSIDLDSEVSDYLLHRSAQERAAFQEGKYKKRFMDLLAELGEEESGGHRVLMLNEPILFHSYKGGKAQEKEVTGIRRQRRAGTQTLSEERTLAFLANSGLLERCTRTIQVLDEDEILAANFDGTITDEDLKKLYDVGDPTFAFYLVEGVATAEEQ
jgi:hypothetical protein